MDSKGYIPISLLASFNRIKQLTLDTRLVKEVLMLSAFVEVNGGMVRMGGAAAAAATSNSNPSSGGLNEGGGQQNRMSNSSSWESFVLPDAVESVVEDVVVENVTDNGYGGYHHHHQQHQQQHQQQQQLNGYGYGGGSTGYGYGYGAAAAGYGYGYGYGYPPIGPTAGLGYYDDLQSQQQQQQHPQHASGYETGEGVVDDQRQQQQQQHEEHVSSHIDHGETVLPSMLMNGHTAESMTATTMTSKLDDQPHHPTSVIKEEEITGKLNGIFKRDQHQQCGDGNGEGCDGEEEEEEEEEEEDVVFVMGGTDVSTSWTPERERRA